MRGRVVGVEHPIPLLDGTRTTYVNLDNASTTPPLMEVMEEIQRFVPYYSSVHRGTGFKSRFCTRAYERARELMLRFVGASPGSNTVVFGKNATEAVNKLAHRFGFSERAVVITTILEHHSNYLPWKGSAEVVVVGCTPEGRLDEADFDEKLARYGDRVELVAVTGASNVTGFIQPIHGLAAKAHAAGAHIFVDAAQLAPHRRIDVLPDE
ncbi:aminotransferase class V-fold PLP-dependent enzyme, partial [Candidatus Fermentibacterales bacterium]|nr:aminotransferase class V-fold PLP-dependent enzyme [Candidatus Fermentibacterales bacterium]